MKKLFAVFGVLGMCFIGENGLALSAGTVAANGKTNEARGVSINAVGGTNGLRGNQGAANAYLTNQRNSYYIVNQLDVDSACRDKIYKCLADYCGDVTVVPGQRSGRCQYSTESELYNYALLCLQKDTTVLVPQYNVKNGNGGVNTAARLCPSYVQQELMSYLSMSNMADKLSKSHSDLCLTRRQELEAAMACHSVALAYGNETTSMLTTQLTDYCGAGVAGGSAEMVTRFANAGNVGANVWGWAEKIVSLEMNKKGSDWQNAVDAVLASYTNRMNLACGDDLQMNTVQHTDVNRPTALQTVAALAVGTAFPTGTTVASNPNAVSLYENVQSLSELWDYNTARQVVMAGLGNSPLTQNSFLTSAQMDNMQNAYKRGTKVFVISDGSRCYAIQVAELSGNETSLLASVFSNCVSR